MGRSVHGLSPNNRTQRVFHDMERRDAFLGQLSSETLEELWTLLAMSYELRAHSVRLDFRAPTH